jgi:hypothetical protein
MTRYARSRLHDEVAAYLAFYAILGPREAVRFAIAVLSGEEN